MAGLVPAIYAMPMLNGKALKRAAFSSNPIGASRRGCPRPARASRGRVYKNIYEAFTLRLAGFPFGNHNVCF
jgi:hypothetical protein